MKVFQAFLALAALAIIMLVIALFLPSNYTVRRITVIKASPADVFSQVSDIRNWHNWDPWSEKDPELKYRLRENDSEGHPIYYWVSGETDYGELKVLKVDAGKGIDYTINFPTYHLASAGGFELRVVKEGTQVTWRDRGDFSWNPIKRFIGLFLVKMVEKDFDRGLGNLKKVCEAKS
jgi:hypothetical protein